MWARATRIEFVIVSVAMLVLLLCSKPPRSGSAGVAEFEDFDTPLASSTEQAPTEDDRDALAGDRTREETNSPEPNESDERPAETLETLSEPVPEGMDTRFATVDARNCNRLDYGDVMYGEVTVRWVWNGTKFVPHKVCVVREKNGVSSVWSFDQSQDAALSEVTPEQD